MSHQNDGRIERLLDSNPTEFERMLLTSADLDLPAPGAAAALLDRLDAVLEGAPIVPIEQARKLQKAKRASTWIFFAAALLGMSIVVLDRTRHPERNPIARDVPTVTAPTNEPAPVAEVPAPVTPATESPVTPVTPVTPVAPATHASASVMPTPKVLAIPKPKSSAAPTAPTALAAQPTDATSAQRLSDDPPFNKGAAAGAMGKVDISECKAFPGPEGSGHVTVTFAPAGGVEKAVIDAPPFEGTARGACVAGKFAQIHVPPFSGASVRVGKTFVLTN